MSLFAIIATYVAILVIGGVLNYIWCKNSGFDNGTNNTYVNDSIAYAFDAKGRFGFWKFFLATFKYTNVYYKEMWNKYSKLCAIYSVVYNTIALPLSLPMIVFVGIYTKIQARCIQKAMADAFSGIAKK